MSYYNLMDESMVRMPSIPNLNATMLFIETHPCLPPISAVSIGRHCTEMLKNLDNFEEENSLGLELDKKTKPHISMASTSSIKKKKTGCTCKKTKCLKMYCECFSSGKMCTPECSCYGCVNDHDHLAEIQNAKIHLQQKYSSASKQAHKGCNCKKSMCQKKYCECFNAGVACGDSCKCEECANGEDPQHNHGHPQKDGLPSTEINAFNSIRCSIYSQPMLSGTFE